ncbi:MAG: Flp pilus assembly complex ATPase component TadA [Candidatus Omnitrophica bacterium]|nr:Flp pilus assembly complex ATPase component TadA [Candidatus Omnitrophota bacterium]
MAYKQQPLGEILIDKKLVTEAQLVTALIEQKKSGALLGETLVRLGFITDEQMMLSVISEQIGVEFVSLRTVKVDLEVLNHLPAKAVNYYKVFPFKFEQGQLSVAMNNPLDVQALDDLAMMAHARIIPVLATNKDIQEAIQEYYGVGAETVETLMVGEKPVTVEAEDIEEIDENEAEASIGKFLNQILYAAHKEGATDIHIEPFAGELRVRSRVDGVLYDVKIPRNIYFFKDALVSRIKILASLNIAEKRVPQDGRFSVRVNDKDLDLRVTFLPTTQGESVVIRILSTGRLCTFEDLGIAGEERKHLQVLLDKPHGIVFMTGPTGSGKTTTLYTCLASLNIIDYKIITVEDPVEYQLKGIIQVPVNPELGFTFASALRSLLRNDPDIIMVGEVRDVETARITIQSALTGHLVFSTLHANDAVSGVTRLLDMGIEPYLIASAVECFIAQRLVRLLCPHCKRPIRITPEIVRSFNLDSQAVTAQIYEAGACKLCHDTGYLGRVAICEFCHITDVMRELILKRSTAAEMKSVAVRHGMKTLRQHGWEKVAAGLSSPSEVLRVTGNE